MTVYRCNACTKEFPTQPEVCSCGARSFSAVTAPETEPATKPEPEHKHRGR